MRVTWKSHECRLIIVQQRINRIQSTLSSDLDHLFSQTLTSLSEANKGDRSKLMIDVTECLRTYDIMGLWRDAEDVLRRDVVREFVKKVRCVNAAKDIH